MITADTITDDQIRELRNTAWRECDSLAEQNQITETANLALCGYRHPEGLLEKQAARAYCAALISARAKENR